MQKRIAALESAADSTVRVGVAFMNYRHDADGSVISANVNDKMLVTRLPGESMDDFDTRALQAAQVKGEPLLKVSWRKPKGIWFE